MRIQDEHGTRAIIRIGWMLAAMVLFAGCPDDEPEGDDDDTGAGDDDAVEPGGEVEVVAVVDFGYQDIGVQASVDVEIRNAGLAPLEIYSVTVTGIEAGILVADFDQPAVLQPELTMVYVNVPLHFTPPETVFYEAVLEIHSSDHRYEPGDPYLVPLSGIGVVDADGDEYYSDVSYDETDADCDDSDPAVHPGAPELCNGIDDDCDGGPGADEVDTDGDGVMVCEGDCDDADPATHPGAEEVCDGEDNDCVDGVPADEQDTDGDGAAACEGDCDDSDPALNLSDADGDGVTSCDGDCDDADAAVYPGATEICNGIDDDCDGSLPANEQDADGDGFAPCEGDCDDGDPALNPADADGDGASSCDGDCDDADPGLNPHDFDADGVSSCDGDCDDADPMIHPGAYDACDGVDDDCDGIVDNPLTGTATAPACVTPTPTATTAMLGSTPCGSSPAPPAGWAPRPSRSDRYRTPWTPITAGSCCCARASSPRDRW